MDPGFCCAGRAGRCGQRGVQGLAGVSCWTCPPGNGTARPRCRPSAPGLKARLPDALAFDGIVPTSDEEDAGSDEEGAIASEAGASDADEADGGAGQP